MMIILIQIIIILQYESHTRVHARTHISLTNTRNVDKTLCR